jgi:predicted secreted protein
VTSSSGVGDGGERSLRTSLILGSGSSGRSSCGRAFSDEVWELCAGLDSSEEDSEHSGVESESNRGRGDRRFEARETDGSSSSRSTLERFFDGGGTMSAEMLGRPVCGPLMLRTEE